MTLELGPPEPLLAEHRVADFECGETVLDDWLVRRAKANQLSGASRTFVVVDRDHRVWGCCALAPGAVSHRTATGGVRRNMPDPVPVMVLVRLPVNRRAKGLELGAALLQDAVQRAVTVSREVAASGHCSFMRCTTTHAGSTSTTDSSPRHCTP